MGENNLKERIECEIAVLKVYIDKEVEDEIKGIKKDEEFIWQDVLRLKKLMLENLLKEI